jgi:hypothetical protein
VGACAARAQVATTLERQAVDLEASAHPALDELTAKVLFASGETG